MATDEKDLFEQVAELTKDLADWVKDTLTDPEVLAQIRADVGLRPDGTVPPGASDQLKAQLESFDVEDAGFAATVASVTTLVQAVRGVVDGLKEPGDDVDEVLYAIFQIGAAEWLRRRYPLIHAVLVLGGQIRAGVEELERIDPGKLVAAVREDGPDTGFDEADAQWLSGVAGTAIHATELLVEKFTASDQASGFRPVRASYGWEPVPGVPNLTESVSERTLTLVAGSPTDPGVQGALTIVVTTDAMGGPGVFLSLGGQVTLEQQVEGTRYALTLGATTALSALIRPRSADSFVVSGDPAAHLRLDVRSAASNDVALRIGDKTRTRIEAKTFEWGIGLAGDSAAFRFALRDGALVVALGEGDGFLSQLGSEIRLGFDVGLTADVRNGVRLDGGTGLRTVIPVNQTAFGVFTLYSVEVALGVAPQPTHDLSLTLTTGFSLHLGPFTATVEGIGFRLDTAFRTGNLGALQVDAGFDPPNGIGLLLDAGVIRGGGYLFIDTVRHEYAGALELSVRPLGLSIKAIGILTTRLPDGSPGWALLLLVFGTFGPVQLSWGFTLNGLGGAIGLQHGVDIGALQAGLRTGAMDAILFPPDPVGNAPAIINTLRTVFPVTPRALVIGPAVELGWGTPSLVRLKLGILLQFENVINARAGAGGGLSRIVVLGQLRIEVPPPEVRAGLPAITQIVCDVLGTYEVASAQLTISARLRDSHIVRIELSGMLVLAANFGARPSFVLAVGGFHPRFTDVPAGLPSPIDRLALGFDIGIVRVRLEVYVAVTSNSFQIGARLEARAKVWEFEIHGWIGFDAIFIDYHFRIDVDAGIRIKAFGKTLAGVRFTGMLEGPGAWHLEGRASFEILWWEESIRIDERWGTAPPEQIEPADVASALTQALGSPDAWSAVMPRTAESLVTLARVDGQQAVAHPQATLRAVEKVVPLGLDIQRFGNARPRGARRFDVEGVTIGASGTPGQAVTPQPVTELFARAQFLDLTDEEKLTRPSFEPFQAGIEVGAPGHVPPPAATCRGRSVAHEVVYLEPGDPDPPVVGGRFRFDLLRVHEVAIATVDEVGWQVRLGASGRSPLRRDARAAGPARPKVEVAAPSFEVVDAATLASTGVVTGSVSAAETVAGAVHDRIVVETFEVPGR